MTSRTVLAALFAAVPVRAGVPASEALGADAGVFRGRVLSVGDGVAVCARATFDAKTAREGARVYLSDSLREETAVRRSAAVATRDGLMSGWAGAAARRHAIPALALGRGVWDPAAKTLVLPEPEYGPVETVDGAQLRRVTGERDLVVAEGTVVCVDPLAAELIVPPAGEAEARLAASEAARAYEGLRDAGAFERWLEAEPGAARAAALMRELAPRVLSGAVKAADLGRLERAARKAAGPGGRGALEAAMRRAWARALAQRRGELEGCAESAEDAPAVDVLDRLTREASALAARAGAGGEAFGGGDGGYGALARACAAAAGRRRGRVPAVSPSLEDAAAAAGASRLEAAELPPEAWRRFLADNGLEEFLSRALDDASLGLRRKSERIRSRILEGRLSAATEAGRGIAAAAASCPCLAVGDDATRPAADPAAAFAAVREVWAASWGPGPLGARLRAGRGGAYDGRVRLVRAPKADFSGLAFTRDPGSGLRRLSVEAAAGGIEGVLDGSSGARDGAAVLGAGRMARVARLARALDAWRGGGVEVAFSFAGDALHVHHARAMEAPRPPQPLSDPLSPAPAPEALGVKRVR